MATKSFLKSINIKGRGQLKDFASALAHAEQRPEKHIDTDSPAYYEVRDPELLNKLLHKYRSV